MLKRSFPLSFACPPFWLQSQSRNQENSDLENEMFVARGNTEEVNRLHQQMMVMVLGVVVAVVVVVVVWTVFLNIFGHVRTLQKMIQVEDQFCILVAQPLSRYKRLFGPAGACDHGEQCH